MCSNYYERYFPHAVPRPGQLALIKAIHDNVALRSHLCVEAANGFGKTIAALTGVLPHIAKQKLGILYIARTHKQMDRAMLELKPLSETNEFTGIVLRGRTASCLNPIIPKYAANPHVAMFICSQLKQSGRCEYYQNYVKKTEKSQNYLKSFYKTPLTGLELRKKCKYEKVCPYELTHQILPLVTVVATTYFQIFDNRISKIFFEAFSHPLSKSVLLLDEVHNLPRIAVEVASSRLSLTSISQSIREAKRYELPLVEVFGNTIENIIKQILETRVGDEIKFDEIKFTSSICQSLKIRNFEVLSKQLLQMGDQVLSKLIAEEKPPISYISSMGRFFIHWNQALQRSDTAFFLINDPSDKAPAYLEIIALDPRTSTVPTLGACYASVHLSGTLKPIDAYIDLIGLPSHTRSLSIPSPFSPSQIFPVISLGVTTAMKFRTPKMFEKISRRIKEVSQATPHNIGVFVPSYTFLQSLLLAGLDSLLDRELFIETPGLSSSKNDALIQKFKGKADQGVALLGVLGGRNSEGEDYPGNEMETVVVVGVPYAKPSPRENTRIEYFESQFPQKGRFYGYQLPALRRASQAAGRSIRRFEDRGAIVFLDDRYATPYCKRLLPAWIIENLRSSSDAEGVLGKRLQAFYSMS